MGVCPGGGMGGGLAELQGIERNQGRSRCSTGLPICVGRVFVGVSGEVGMQNRAKVVMPLAPISA
jgi:hypothetical protein